MYLSTKATKAIVFASPVIMTHVIAIISWNRHLSQKSQRMLQQMLQQMLQLMLQRVPTRPQ